MFLSGLSLKRDLYPFNEAALLNKSYVLGYCWTKLLNPKGLFICSKFKTTSADQSNEDTRYIKKNECDEL